MKSEQIRESRLPNGIQIVTEQMPHSRSVTLGIWVRSGPRYETPAQAGISHFLEHMLFKGTTNRTARQINESLYPAGGHLNAFTEREVTCYTAVVLGEHLPLAIEVLSDMLTHSLFAEEELVREKGVILEEIKSVEDTPEDLVHDLLANAVWPNHPLGRPVIGWEETVASLSRRDVLGYFAARYSPTNTLISAAGALEHDAVVENFDRWLGDVTGESQPLPFDPPEASAQTEFQFRRTKQAHLSIGLPAYRQEDDNNYPLILIDTVLGGGAHSRLWDEIRENRGLAYSVGSTVSAYAESGLFTLYASTARRSLETVVRIIRDEMRRMANEGLSQEELDLARQHIRSSLILSNESAGARMGRLASSFLYFGRMVPIEEVLSHLDQVTREDLLRVARDVLQPEKAAMAVIGSIEPGSKIAERLTITA